MRLSEDDREKLRHMTVELVLELRAAHLRTGQANPLRHWDQIQDRLRAAARTSTSVEGWATELGRSLRVGSPTSSHAAALTCLADRVRELGAAREWLDLVEEEFGYLMALARSLADTRKETAAP